MARKKKHEEHVNHERWLVSYADFITLLFATFVALFAISNADMEKFRQMVSSMDRAFNGDRAASLISLSADPGGGGDLVIQIVEATQSRPSRGGGDGGRRGGEGDQPFDPMQAVMQRQESGRSGDGPQAEGADDAPGKWPDGDEDETIGATGMHAVLAQAAEQTTALLAMVPEPAHASEPTEAGEAEELGTPEGRANEALVMQIRQLLDEIGLEGKVEVRREPRGTVISLGEAAFFAPGGVDVLPQSVHTLDRILNALRGKDFEMRIEGHTDNTPVSAGRPYRNNEELSALRASRIMEFMMREYGFAGERLSVAGYGPWRPVADNSTPEGRQKNRRVDLVILNQLEASREPR